MATARLDALDTANAWSKARSSPFACALAFGSAERPGTKGTLGKLIIKPNPSAEQGDTDDQRRVRPRSESQTQDNQWGEQANTSQEEVRSQQDVQSRASSHSQKSAGEKRSAEDMDVDNQAEVEADKLTQQEEVGFDVQVSFVSFPEFDSLVEVKIRQFWPHPTKSGKQQSRIVKLMLNRESITGPITFTSFKDKAQEWAARYGISKASLFKLKDAAKTYENRLWEVCVPFTPQGMAFQNLYSANEENEDPLWSRLRATLEQPGEFRMMVQAEGVNKMLQSLNEEMEQLRQTDPIDAWFPSSEKKFIQIGMTVSKENRPQIKLGEYNVFQTFDKYLTVVGHACIGEAECAEVDAQPFCASLRVLELPGSNGSTYFGFVTDLPEGRRLNSGDILRLHPHDDGGEVDNDSAWTAQVIDPLPFANLTDYSLVLYRAQADNEWDDLDLGQVKNVKDLKSFEDALEAVTQAKAQTATFKVNTSNKNFRHQIASLRVLTDNTNSSLDLEREILLANKPSLLPMSNIYGSILGNPQLTEYAQIMTACANEGQLQALRGLCSLPGGIGIIEGPPGTGKSHIICLAVLPLMRLPPDNKAPHQPVMILSASNKAVTQLAARLQAISTAFEDSLKAKQQHFDEPMMIIRVHSLSTEYSITIADAESARPKSRLQRFENDLPDISDMIAAKVLMDRYTAETQQKYPGIMDKRVQDMEMSLGHRMLQISGFSDSPWAKRGNEEHSEFRRLFNEYRSGATFDKEKKTLFSEHIGVLRNATLRKAHAVITTPAIAGEFKLREAIQPRVIVVDEAARCPEFDMWHILAWYSQAIRVLVGDTRQLRPFSHPENDLYRQASVSLMRRLARAGYRTLQLTEQQRFAEEICNVISPLFYENMLTTSPAVSSRPENAKFRSWAHSMFGIESNVVLINTIESKAMQDASGSSFNVMHGRLGMGLIRSLLDHGFAPEDIGALCAYQAQWNLYGRGITQLQAERTETDLRAIRREKVDGFQGDEITVEILDLTVTSKPGFLKDTNRVNTALTRARAGLVILINHRGLANTNSGYQGTELQRLFGVLRKQKKITSMKNDAIEKRFPALDDTITRAAGFEQLEGFDNGANDVEMENFGGEEGWGTNQGSLATDNGGSEGGWDANQGSISTENGGGEGGWGLDQGSISTDNGGDGGNWSAT